MAHFARITDDGVVKQVIVIANDVITDDEGVEQESLGQAFIASLGLEGNWLQCSYSGAFRGAFPGIEWVYDAVADEFTPPVREDSEVPEA